jgi:uncharacterized protein
MNGLRFNVAALLKEPAGAAREYSVDITPEGFASLVEDARPIAPLAGRVRFMRTPRSVYARGDLHTTVVVECSRCLADATVPVGFEVDTEYFPSVDIGSGHTLPEPDDDLAFTIDPNHELDLSEMVRQELLVALPMQVICRETCKGLCPTCGADLNEGPCNCEDDVLDSRLSALRALLEREAGG